MQVILQKDVKNLGLTGHVVSVKRGYARHFLFPKKWAVPFTKARASETAHRQQWIASRQKKARKERGVWFEKLQNTSLSFTREADAHGHLFGSVSPADIARELEKQNYEVDKKWVVLERPLKKTGEHKVTLKVESHTSTIVVTIEPSKTIKTPAEKAKKAKTAKTKTTKPDKTKTASQKTADSTSTKDEKNTQTPDKTQATSQKTAEAKSHEVKKQNLEKTTPAEKTSSDKQTLGTKPAETKTAPAEKQKTPETKSDK